LYLLSFITSRAPNLAFELGFYSEILSGLIALSHAAYIFFPDQKQFAIIITHQKGIN